MLPERASSPYDVSISRPPTPTAASAPPSRIPAEVRAAVEQVLAIEAELPANADSAGAEAAPLGEAALAAGGSAYLGAFVGRLKLDSEAAYAQLDSALHPLNAFALFRDHDGKHLVALMAGRINPPARPLWPHLALFVATFFSVLLVGTEMAISEIAGAGATQAEITALINNFWGELWRGLPYALAIMAILGAHELGHYFAGRAHKLSVTLPYFIPMPFNNIGTFGAFIQLRQPMRNRKVLLDIGLAGPLFGLLFAIPILFWGLSTSPIKVIQEGIVEGNSLLYALMKMVVFGEFLPNGTYDVYVNQLAWAGWTGLLVTGLNLIPVGQLDGGHVLYSLLGARARRAYLPLMIAMLCLVVFTVSISPVWIVWALLLLVFGRVYAVPLDDLTPLNPARQRWAALGLLLFVVTFVPLPLAPIEAATLPDGAAAWLPLVVGLATFWTRRGALLGWLGRRRKGGGDDPA